MSVVREPGVRFDIMTGLVKPVQVHSDSNRPSGGYLTLNHLIALGLALIIVLSSCTELRFVTTITPTPNQVGEIQRTGSPEVTIPASSTTQTPLPDIPATPNESTPSPLGVMATQLQGLQVSLWHPWTGTTGGALQFLLDEFSLNNPWGITVQASAYEGFGRLDEAMDEALLSDREPDLIVDYPYQGRHWENSDALTDLTPYTDDPVWGLTSGEQADFYPAFWVEDLVYDDNSGQTRRMGIPFYRSAYILFYNQSWAKEMGYPDLPRTPEDFRVRACAAAESNGSSQNQGGWLITPQPGGLVGWIYAFEGGITNPDGSGYLFNTPETYQALAYLKGLKDTGCAWSQPDADPQAEFANRHALFVVGSLFDIPAQRKAFSQAVSTDEWTVISFPSDQKPVMDTYGPSLLMTHSNPAQQLAAWLVMKWLVYPPNQAYWVQATGTLPTRQSTLEYLKDAAGTNLEWGDALKLLPDARSEPALASWSVMRWALNDVMNELFDPGLEISQIPVLMINLSDVAMEINSQVR